MNGIRNTQPFGYSKSSILMVAGDHDGGNTGFFCFE
jgi:hypothetical protein